MVVVPAGRFVMGASLAESQAQFYAAEIPQHIVSIAKPFAVSKYEVTFAEWDTCATYGDCANDNSDNGWGRGQQPVINVTWDDARTYVKWLSKVTGKTYRLLSEAQYEYAVRAGTQTLYPWGNDVRLNGEAMANCNGCGSKWDNQRTAPIGSFPPNKFGLYDMVGNVFEWTEDCVHNNYNGAPTDGSAWLTGGDCKDRVVRGGSWSVTPVNLRSAARNFGATGYRGDYLGFRVARMLAAGAGAVTVAPGVH
jgi:formylglycine-generating enzyme required for sulfatase activity